jgi:oligopeptide/dipeptide ABC transporter ATP-binding protein
VADEPTTALDVSIQAQIIALLKTLTKEQGAAVMLVTHDMGVIAETCDRVAVMYAGRVVEIGPVAEVIHRPAHPYTVGLMGSIPAMDEDRERLMQIDGAMPRLNAIPTGCAFNPRCPRVMDRCRSERPDLLPAGATRAACWLHDARCPHDGAGGSEGPGQDLRRLGALAEPGDRAPAAALRACGRWRQLRHPRGTTLALVGESGCGKSTVARLLVGLYGPTRGTVEFDGIDTAATLASPGARALRKRMQMIFQDPYASLNPRWKVRDIVGEPLREHGLAMTEPELEAKVAALLAQVGLARPTWRSFRTSSRAGSASASPSPGRWPPSPSS